jgi:hypothetical protein
MTPAGFFWISRRKNSYGQLYVSVNFYPREGFSFSFVVLVQKYISPSRAILAPSSPLPILAHRIA